MTDTSKLKPVSKAWRAITMLATDDERAGVMQVADYLQNDTRLEDGPTLYGLSQMSAAEFRRKYRANHEVQAVAVRALETVSLTFKS